MTNTLRRITSPLVLLALGGSLAAACQEAEPRDLGYTQGDQDLRREPQEPFLSDPQEFVGRWIGTADDPLAIGRDRDYVFPSGSRRFVVDIDVVTDEFGNETVEAKLTFGAGEPPPPPVDADSGYPVGFSYLDALTYDPGPYGLYGTNPDLRLPPFEGFAYRAELLNGFDDGDLSVADGLLVLGFTVNQVLDPWCVLQTPFELPTGSGFFQCQELFGGGFEVNADGTGASCQLDGPADVSTCPEDPTAEELVECLGPSEVVAEVNCDKLFICANNFCQCDASSCYAGGEPDQLVLRREGDELIGVFAGTTFVNARNMKTPLGDLRLRRAD